MSPTGHNLKFTVTGQKDWLTFSCWASIKRRLPDSEIYVLSPLFSWAKKDCVLRTKEIIGNSINENFILLRQYNNFDWSWSDSNNISPFVQLRNVVGPFSVNGVAPFYQFYLPKLELTVNEKAIIEYWKSIGPLYNIMSH